MKKFFLLMALVLTAGVVQAQGLNFGQRANLTQAVRLDADFPSNTILNGNGTGTVGDVSVTYFNGWDADEKKLFWSGNPEGSIEVTIFSHDYITNYLNGRSLLNVFENFVIRAKDTSEWKHYYGQGPLGEVTYNSSDNTAVTYAVCFYSGNTLLSTMMFWSGDVKIAPLRALCQSDKATELRDDEINSIDRVTIKSNSPNGQVYIEEAYFISALKELDYTDKNGIDIGNAYIDPSYLIRSNRLWVSINDGEGDEPNDRTFKMILAPEVANDSTYFYRTYKDNSNNIVYTDDPVYTVYTDQSHQIVSSSYPSYDSNTGLPIYNNDEETLYGPDGNEVYVKKDKNDKIVMYYSYPSGAATLYFSLPYESGIDMSDVTFTALDFDRNADVLERCIYENKRVDLHRNPTNNGSPEYIAWTEKARDVLVRNLYNSRYNGPFYDQNGGNALDLSRRGDDAYISDKAIKHVNSIYWQSSLNRFHSQSDLNYYKSQNNGNGNREITCQDISFTKNTIKARKTRKPLNPEDWTDRPEGFRNLDYPVRPYYRDENNWSDVVRGYWDASLKSCYTDLSRFNKMRISGSPNTVFNIRYATSLNGNEVTQWEPELHVKTDARGEANIDLDIYPAFYMQLIYFDGLYNVRQQIGNSDDDGTPQMSEIRKTHYVNDVELFEGEGRLVDLVGSSDPSNTANMYHVYNVDNNYQWQYGTVVNWAVNQGGQSQFTQDNIVSNGAVIWGSMGLYPENYADLTGYKAIRVYSDSQISSNAVRFVFNTLYNKDGTFTRQDIPVLLNKAVDDHHYYPELDGLYYAELDISNYEYFHLNGIKALADFEVKAIKLVEDEEADYVCYGNGSCYEQKRAAIDPSVEKAVGDATAKVIDMRARCNNMEVPFDGTIFGWVQQTQLPYTANPNVLYIQRTNQFESRKIVDNADTYAKVNFITPSNRQYNADGSSEYFSEYFTSNNIELSDGYSFYAPKQIKAEHAQYTRTFNNANTVNTIIIPFAVDAGSETAKKSAGFYVATNTLQSTATEGRVGILGEQEVNEGDWLLQFSKYTGTTDSNVPYLYAVTDEPGKNVFEGVATENGKVIIKETPDVLVEGKRRMSNYDYAKTLVNGEMKEGYYLRGVYEGTYMEDILFYSGGKLYRTPRTTVTPFRTIIHSPIPVLSTEADNSAWKEAQDSYFNGIPAGNVKVVLAFDPDDDQAVAIENVEVDGLFAEDAPIYNVAGQRVNTLEKGIYIVAGKKILVK